MLRLLRRHGVRDVAANLHYHPDEIRTYFGDGSAFGVRLDYNFEEELLGTAGGVGDVPRTARRRHVRRGQRRRPDRHRPHGLRGRAPRLAAGSPRWPSSRSPTRPCMAWSCADDAGRVTGFQEKPRAARGALGLVQLRHLRLRAGDLRATCPRGRSSTGPRTSSRRCSPTTSRSTAGALEGYWNDVGNIEQYRIGNFDALLGPRGRSSVPGREMCPGRLGRRGYARSIPACGSTRPILIGAGCLVEAEARAHRSADRRRRLRHRARRRARGRHHTGTASRPAATARLAGGILGRRRRRPPRRRGPRGCRHRRPAPMSRPAPWSTPGRASSRPLFPADGPSSGAAS